MPDRDPQAQHATVKRTARAQRSSSRLNLHRGTALEEAQLREQKLFIFTARGIDYPASAMSLLTPAELSALLTRAFPDFEAEHYTFEEVTDSSLRLRREVHRHHLRPGGTVLGPVMMEIADAAAYFCVIAPLGAETRAYTTSLTIHFFRRPSGAHILAEARILKRGKKLAVADVALFSPGEEAPVAHAVGAYSIE